MDIFKDEPEEITERNTKDIPQLVESILNVNESKLVVAGGYALKVYTDDANTYPDFKYRDQDIDFWLIKDFTKDERQQIIDKILSQGYQIHKEYAKGTIKFIHKTGGIPIQLMPKHQYNNPHALIRTFDLSQCMIAYNLGRFFLNERTKKALQMKMQSLNEFGIIHPSKTLSRIFKYHSRGYRGEAAAKYLMDIVSLNPKMNLEPPDPEKYV